MTQTSHDTDAVLCVCCVALASIYNILVRVQMLTVHPSYSHALTSHGYTVLLPPGFPSLLKAVRACGAVLSTHGIRRAKQAPSQRAPVCDTGPPPSRPGASRSPYVSIYYCKIIKRNTLDLVNVIRKRFVLHKAVF